MSKTIWRLLLVLLPSLAALAAPVAAQPHDDDPELPHLTGSFWIHEVTSNRRYPVELTQSESNPRSVTAVFGNVKPDPTRDVAPGKPLFTATLADDNVTLSGDITIRGPSERSGPQSRETGLTLRYDREQGVWAGQHKNWKWEEQQDGDRWIDRGAWPIRLIPPCRPLRGPIRLGVGDFRVEIGLTETLYPIHGEHDDGARPGLCHYKGEMVASLTIQTGDQGSAAGVFARQLAVTGLDIEVYLRHGSDSTDPKAYREVSLGWGDDGTGQFPLLQLEGRLNLQFLLYSVGITFVIDNQGRLGFGEAFIEAYLAAESDIHLGGPVYLGGDLATIIRYDWNAGASSWTQGTWSFDGLAGVELQVRREGTIPIAVLRLEADEQGVITGELTLTPSSSWTAYGFEIALAHCNLRAEINLRAGSWRFIDGSITGTLKAKSPSSTELAVTLSVTRDQFSLGIAASGFRIFGGTCQDVFVHATLDANRLAFTQVEGRLKWKHDQFQGNHISITQFRIKDGELDRFVGSGGIEYKGFALAITELNYDGTVNPGLLRVSASMNLGWSGVTVSSSLRNFTIDTNGTISEFQFHAEVDATAANATIDGGFVNRADRTEVNAGFRGRLAGSVELAGSVVVGRDRPADASPYTYGALEFSVNFARGVPLGNTGLSVYGVGGGFGFNYVPDGAPAEVGPKGPKNGQHYLSAQITLGDAARLIELTGRIRVHLGRTTALQITGTLKITGRTPYFEGTLDVSHALHSGVVAGSLTTSIKIPSSGTVVNISQNRVNFAIRTIPSDQWTVGGRNLGGRFFRALDISRGTIDLSSTMSAPIRNLSGSLGCRLSASASKSASRSLAGFTLSGSLEMSVNGSADVQLDEGGMTGSFDIRASASGRVTLATPSVTAYGYEVIASRSFSEYVSASATLRCRTSPSNSSYLRCSGDFRVSTSLGSTTLSFTHDF